MARHSQLAALLIAAVASAPEDGVPVPDGLDALMPVHRCEECHQAWRTADGLERHECPAIGLAR